MRRRDFIKMLCGVTAWPAAARAQQRNQMRRIGVLMSQAADDPEAQRRLGVFLQGLQDLGWNLGRNIQIDYRWVAGNIEHYRSYAAVLVALSPDIVVTSQGTLVDALQQATRSLPIVFVGIIDAVANRRVESLARPGGNVTGFTGIEYGISGKWLEMLKEIAPRVARVGVIRDSGGPGGPAQYDVLQNVAPSFKVELHPIGVDNTDEIERGITAFARGSNAGLVVVESARAHFHRGPITSLAARFQLPAVYSSRSFVTAGGLISYGPDPIDQWHLAAGYVNRILKGEKPGDLPVQTPTKFELTINLKTANGLGMAIPPALRALANEVIE